MFKINFAVFSRAGSFHRNTEEDFSTIPLCFRANKFHVGIRGLHAKHRKIYLSHRSVVDPSSALVPKINWRLRPKWLWYWIDGEVVLCWDILHCIRVIATPKSIHSHNTRWERPTHMQWWLLSMKWTVNKQRPTLAIPNSTFGNQAKIENQVVALLGICKWISLTKSSRLASPPTSNIILFDHRSPWVKTLNSLSSRWTASQHFWKIDDFKWANLAQIKRIPGSSWKMSTQLETAVSKRMRYCFEPFRLTCGCKNRA